jgi:hypothetical protein
VVLRSGVQGGFFWRKKPLKLVLPVYSNSETAIAVSNKKGRPQAAFFKKLEASS